MRLGSNHLGPVPAKHRLNSKHVRSLTDLSEVIHVLKVKYMLKCFAGSGLNLSVSQTPYL